MKNTEDESKKILQQCEDEIDNIVMKYSKQVEETLKKKSESIKKFSSELPDYWYTALSNHKLFHEFLSPVDEEPLKKLIDIRYERLGSQNVRESLL